MIHGLVDRPLTFTVDDLKRLPSVTRLHFIECAGNRASRRAKTVQETHGMTSMRNGPACCCPRCSRSAA